MQDILHMHKFYTLCCLSMHFAKQKIGNKSSKRDHVNPLEVEEKATYPLPSDKGKPEIFWLDQILNLDLISRPDRHVDRSTHM